MPDFTFTLDSGPVTVSASGPTLHVGWCSDWCRIDDLKRAGYLVTRRGGPGTFGDVDWFVAPGWKPESEPEPMQLFAPAPNQIPGQMSL